MKLFPTIIRLTMGLVVASSLLACSREDTKYTLYRSGFDFATNTANIGARIHLATFDADEGVSSDDRAKYNQANCDFAQELFNAKQPHYSQTAMGKVSMKYWCEKGAYKK